MRVIHCDGSPEAVRDLDAAVRAMLAGGEAVAPVGPRQPRPAPEPLTGFDAVLLGGAAAPEHLLRRARAAGLPVVTTYGMTETAGGCVYDGWPLDGTQVRLDGDGSIELAGPTLATGYLDDPEATAQAFHDGWVRTCGLGRLDPR